MMAPAPGKLALFLAAIFCAGAVSGIALGYNSARKSLAKPATAERVCSKMKDTLRARLGLTADQMSRIEPILDQTARDLHCIHRKTMEDVQQLFQKSNAEIARELTREQQAKFEELNKERYEFWQNRMKTNRHRQEPGATNGQRRIKALDGVELEELPDQAPVNSQPAR